VVSAPGFQGNCMAFNGNLSTLYLALNPSSCTWCITPFQYNGFTVTICLSIDPTGIVILTYTLQTNSGIVIASATYKGTLSSVNCCGVQLLNCCNPITLTNVNCNCIGSGGCSPCNYCPGGTPTTINVTIAMFGGCFEILNGSYIALCNNNCIWDGYVYYNDGSLQYQVSLAATVNGWSVYIAYFVQDNPIPQVFVSGIIAFNTNCCASVSSFNLSGSCVAGSGAIGVVSLQPQCSTMAPCPVVTATPVCCPSSGCGSGSGSGSGSSGSGSGSGIVTGCCPNPVPVNLLALVTINDGSCANGFYIVNLTWIAGSVWAGPWTICGFNSQITLSCVQNTFWEIASTGISFSAGNTSAGSSCGPPINLLFNNLTYQFCGSCIGAPGNVSIQVIPSP
jgi:hypothetical protein